jgi:DNA segregation ATPase FtsK/SpoIIIE, S-DNA-T family
MDNKERMDDILRSFKIKAHCCNYKKIRNISLYDLQLEVGAKVRDLKKFQDEISIAMKSWSAPFIRIKPDLGIVRLEVVDEKPHLISFLKDKPDDSNKEFYLGNSIDGEDVNIDVSKNPHMIIAGCTGSGKTTLLHTIIANSLIKNIQTYIIDSKNVEFIKYSSSFENKINIANTYEEAYRMLQFLYNQMEYRYSVMRDITTQDSKIEPILFIIDEFADLIMQDDEKAFHKLLCKLTQKCRAAQIYCILATQRPSVDIISGSIKANFPARISCQTASSMDSRVILDTNGAELLSGNGDAIIKNYKYNYSRFQVAYSDPEEICAKYA